MTISNILITGGTGFVGQWMHKTQPAKTAVCYQSQLQYEHEWDKGNWDAIVHLAPVSPSRVLKYASKHNCKVLFASSGAVYEGTNEYAYHKRMWEADCFTSGVKVTIARLFTFIGEGLKNLYAVTHFIENAKQGKSLEVWGDGSTVRSYLYGEDLGRWMWKILLEGHGIYDVGSIESITILELARLIADMTGSKIMLMNDGSPSSYYMPETERVRNLGCRETVSLVEALERMLK